MTDYELLDLIDRACKRLGDAEDHIFKLVRISDPFDDLNDRFEKYKMSQLHDEFLNTMRGLSIDVQRALHNLDAYRWCFSSRVDYMSKEFYELLAAINEIEDARKDEEKKRLDALAKTDSFEHEGEVVALFGEERDEKGRAYGEIVVEIPERALNGEVDEDASPIDARLELNAEDYAVAATAHLTGQKVVFKGILGYALTGANIKRVENFRIMAEEKTCEGTDSGTDVEADTEVDEDAIMEAVIETSEDDE